MNAYITPQSCKKTQKANFLNKDNDDDDDDDDINHEPLITTNPTFIDLNVGVSTGLHDNNNNNNNNNNEILKRQRKVLNAFEP